ncbi:MAG: nicotinate-nucleotide adenylyltransferase [Bacillota bacterium]|nr:nicotinate-nucleotide adenylyltransferase [Bacillota bacterium]
MKKIGIFGGSFDPIHEAHISLAQDALRECNLHKVILVPAKLQPFKLDKQVTPAEDRLEMVRRAAQGEENIDVSDYEICRDEISYSYLTMREMSTKYHGCRLYFITGTDAFLMIEKWMEAEELLNSYSFIIGTRPGYREDELKECMNRIKDKYGTEIININNVQIDVSSTEIRDKLAAGKSIKGLVPVAVENYINEKGLYR